MMNDPWRLEEWNAIPEECFIKGCINDDIDQRGPVITKDGTMHKACVEHWTGIFSVLGDQATWEHNDAMRSNNISESLKELMDALNSFTYDDLEPLASTRTGSKLLTTLEDVLNSEEPNTFLRHAEILDDRVRQLDSDAIGELGKLRALDHALGDFLSWYYRYIDITE